MNVNKLPRGLQTQGICFTTQVNSKYLTAKEVEAAFNYVLENCVVTAAQPAKPLHWTRLRMEN